MKYFMERTMHKYPFLRTTETDSRGTDSLVTIQASKYYGDGTLRIKKYARI